MIGVLTFSLKADFLFSIIDAVMTYIPREIYLFESCQNPYVYFKLFNVRCIGLTGISNISTELNNSLSMWNEPKNASHQTRQLDVYATHMTSLQKYYPFHRVAQSTNSSLPAKKKRLKRLIRTRLKLLKFVWIRHVKFTYPYNVMGTVSRNPVRPFMDDFY